MPPSTASHDRDIELEMAVYEIAGDNEAYLHGSCHVFALALAELSGLPTGAFVEFNEDLGRDCLVHAFVLDDASDENMIIDLHGRRTMTAESCTTEFPAEFPCRTTMSADELVNIGAGENGVASIRGEIDAALPVARLIYALALEQRELAKVDPSPGAAPV